MTHATLLLRNANLITSDPRRPRAHAMAVAGDRILAVGSDADVTPFIAPATRVLDLAGKTVTPGFIDCHVHLFWYGMQLLKQADLVGTRDLDDLLQRFSAVAARTRTGWIQGHGFDQSKMSERRFPTRADLDRISTSRPILISRICGHAVVVNSAALKLVTAQERAAGDEATGLYTENAANAFHARIPQLPEDEMEDALLAAARVALSSGITSVQTLLDTPDQMIGYARLKQKGKLPLRVVGLPPEGAVDQLHSFGINTGFGDDRLRFGAAKFFSDGSLGAQTALLSMPYADKPGELGIRMYDPAVLKARVKQCQGKGFQIAIHAIGDQAVRESLDAIEHALAGQDNRFWRHRIEHASLTPPDCLERMARLGIVVTCQPQFVTSDTWTSDRIGPDRVPWAYPFKSLLKAGVPIGLSSDCPVEKLDARDCLWAATERHPWSHDERLTMDEAITAYTLGSAYAAGMERVIGSLEPGKLADFVVLDRDPVAATGRRVRELTIESVWVGGRRVESGAAEPVSE